MIECPVVILCGGMGTRMREQTEFIPKPLINIGGKPILVHIMKHYSRYGFKEFILSLGYKQEVIKEYFLHYDEYAHDAFVSTGGYRGQRQIPETYEDQWNIRLVDTGLDTMKGARIKRVQKYIKTPYFLVTYGDGLCDVNIQELFRFHKAHGKLVTVTGIHPAPRFGEILCDADGKVNSFSEKPHSDNHWVNGGFFVFSFDALEFLTEDSWCDLEVGPLELIAAKGEMMVYRHEGWWGCVDTVKEAHELDDMYRKGVAPWVK